MAALTNFHPSSLPGSTRETSSRSKPLAEEAGENVRTGLIEICKPARVTFVMGGYGRGQAIRNAKTCSGNRGIRHRRRLSHLLTGFRFHLPIARICREHQPLAMGLNTRLHRGVWFNP